MVEGAGSGDTFNMRAPILTHKRARSLRRNLTPPEAALWARLRRRQPDRPAFRRQHPLGPFILDFYCAKARLAVEVDGFVHETADYPERDIRRTAWLKAQGIDVLRIPAAEVFRDADKVASRIWTLVWTRLRAVGL